MTRVVSRATCWAVEPGDRLQAARKRAELSRSVVADRSGYSVSGIGALENGQNKIRPEVAKVLAPIVGTTPEWLLYGTGAEDGARRVRRTVPLVGFVGAGAQAHYYASADEGLGEVDAPEDATETTVAAEIRGVSLGPALDRWLVFYDEVRSPVTPDMHGRLCVVGLDDERVLVKVIRPAGEPGRFHLISNGAEEPIFDQAVMWAAKVTGMKPR